MGFVVSDWKGMRWKGYYFTENMIPRVDPED